VITLLSRHLIDSTLFCLLMGGVACCLKRQRAAARYSLWLMGIAKFGIPTALLAATGARIAFLVPASAAMAILAAKFSGFLSAVFGWLPANINAKEATAASVSFFVIWIAGAAATSGAWAVRLRGCYRRLESSSEAEREVLLRARQRLGVNEPIRLLRSERQREPSLLGIWRSIITVPLGLKSELSASEFETVLLHELAHARRRDNLTGAFVHLVVCIFWFHPLLWLAEKRLVAERERACDEMVVRCGAIPEVYIGGILKVCRFQFFDQLAGVSAMTGSDLKTRLELILASPAGTPGPRVGRCLFFGASLVMTLLPVAGGYCQQCVSIGGQQAVARPCSPPTSRVISGSKQRRESEQHSCGE
jgi:beta-lactamase regulating signal transducer with metallopeptidase domain